MSEQESNSETTADLAAIHETGRKNMRHGAMWCIGGIIVTVATYGVARSSGGGGYVVAWGAIIFGGIQFFRGLMQSEAE